MLGYQRALQLVAFLARHGRDVEWIAAGGLLVLLLLELPTVDKLHVADRGPARPTGVRIFQAAAQDG
jgi:hypothetical protein